MTTRERRVNDRSTRRQFPFVERRRTVLESTVLVRALLWVAISLAAILFLLHIYHTLLVFAFAWGITYALWPAVRWLSERPIPKLGRPLSWSASVAVVYLLVTVVFVVCLVFSVPAVVEQVRTMAEDAPSKISAIQVSVADWQGRFERWRIPSNVKLNLETW